LSQLLSIATAPGPATIGAHTIRALPVLVIFPHNQCNCRCMMCDIWRIREAKQLEPADLQPHIKSFRELGVRWVVFSGGEPQLNEKWSWLAQMVRSTGSRVTLLTAGLLLKSQAPLIAECIDDVIVSLDGPPAVHNTIRRVANAFEQMSAGVKAIREIRPDMEVRARCTVQKANRHALRAVVASAREIGLNSISFLAADLTSRAFNRPEGWTPDRGDRVALIPEEIDELENEIEDLIDDERSRPDRGFVVERPEKLRKIIQHFRAHIGQAHQVGPRCNAPWVSAVIEASGDVRPCFFHPVVGNIHKRQLQEIINSPQALQFRSTLDVADNETCRRCVCSLFIAQENA